MGVQKRRVEWEEERSSRRTRDRDQEKKAKAHLIIRRL